MPFFHKHLLSWPSSINASHFCEKVIFILYVRIKYIYMFHVWPRVLARTQRPQRELHHLIVRNAKLYIVYIYYSDVCKLMCCG